MSIRITSCVTVDKDVNFTASLESSTKALTIVEVKDHHVIYNIPPCFNITVTKSHFIHNILPKLTAIPKAVVVQPTKPPTIAEVAPIEAPVISTKKLLKKVEPVKSPVVVKVKPPGFNEAKLLKQLKYKPNKRISKSQAALQLEWGALDMPKGVQMTFDTRSIVFTFQLRDSTVDFKVTKPSYYNVLLHSISTHLRLTDAQLATMHPSGQTTYIASTSDDVRLIVIKLAGFCHRATKKYEKSTKDTAKLKLGQEVTFIVNREEIIYKVNSDHLTVGDTYYSQGARIFDCLGISSIQTASDAYEYKPQNCSGWPRFKYGDLAAASRLVTSVQSKVDEFNIVKSYYAVGEVITFNILHLQLSFTNSECNSIPTELCDRLLDLLDLNPLLFYPEHEVDCASRTFKSIDADDFFEIITHIKEKCEQRSAGIKRGDFNPPQVQLHDTINFCTSEEQFECTVVSPTLLIPNYNDANSSYADLSIYSDLRKKWLDNADPREGFIPMSTYIQQVGELYAKQKYKSVSDSKYVTFNVNGRLYPYEIHQTSLLPIIGSAAVYNSLASIVGLAEFELDLIREASTGNYTDFQYIQEDYSAIERFIKNINIICALTTFRIKHDIPDTAQIFRSVGYGSELHFEINNKRYYLTVTNTGLRGTYATLMLDLFKVLSLSEEDVYELCETAYGYSVADYVKGEFFVWPAAKSKDFEAIKRAANALGLLCTQKDLEYQVSIKHYKTLLS